MVTNKSTKDSATNKPIYIYIGEDEKSYEWLKTILEAVANRLERLVFRRFPKLVSVAAGFFYMTSYITYLLNITVLGRYLYTIFLVSTVLKNHKALWNLSTLLREEGILEGLRQGLPHFDGWIVGGLLSFSVLLELIFINMILVLCPPVHHRILSTYGSDILRRRGYNTFFKNIVKIKMVSSVPALVAGTVMVANTGADVYKTTVHSQDYNTYSKTYEEYLKNPVGKLPPTPPSDWKK